MPAGSLSLAEEHPEGAGPKGAARLLHKIPQEEKEQLRRGVGAQGVQESRSKGEKKAGRWGWHPVPTQLGPAPVCFTCQGRARFLPFPLLPDAASTFSHALERYSALVVDVSLLQC